MNAPDAQVDIMLAARRATAGGSVKGGGPTGLGAADWLGLAAAPSFAFIALLAGVHGGGAGGMLCSAARDGSPLSGMVPMYWLMSAFHLTPWLKLIARRRGGGRRPRSGVPLNNVRRGRGPTLAGRGARG
jgi:hypothetical protein